MSDVDLQTTTVRDVEQLRTFAALASLGYVFWVCGGMEMVERLAYYGVRQVSGLYATDAVSHGGLGLVASDLGIIFGVWAVVQTFVPVFTGGISDRIGYKVTIFASTIIKILGYLTMAWFASFWGFMAGAVILAFGTGIFKPGIQATIVKSTNRRNSSMAWGAFYQTVNIGAFIGPIVAAQMRQLAWHNVFYACASIIAINFLLLATYKEPGKDERLARRAALKQSGVVEVPLYKESLKELLDPTLLWYILLFSGFWFSLYLIWDVGPLYFRDWVDTRPLVAGLFGPGGTSNEGLIFFFGLSRDGTRMMPEGLVNLDAMAIMFICFLVAGFGARFRATNAMSMGAVIASLSLLAIGLFTSAWVVAAAIIVFSIGEMLSSPKSSEFLGNIAPSDKKAMYLGFSQIPIGVGWTLESYLGPTLYGAFASKEELSRDALQVHGMTAVQIHSVPIGEAFDKLVAITGQTPEAVTATLYNSHNIGALWYLAAGVGLLTAVGLYIYGHWTYRRAMHTEARPANQ